jgi:hypothetical protein
MGACQYCGLKAGLFRSEHVECEAKHSDALNAIAEVSRDAAMGTASLVDVATTVRDTATAFVSPAEVKASYIQGFEMAVGAFLNDGILDASEEEHILAFLNAIHLTSTEVDVRGAYSRVVKSAVLRDLLNGKVPTRVQVTGLTLNLQKGEQIIWHFPGVRYFEDKTRKQYVGSSSGVSIRIARGVYYRFGEFRGHPVEHTERVHVDDGALTVTTKQLYFVGPRKSFRIRHDKIVSFIPFSDGVGVVRDAATAKPQIFVTGDGWFSYNLLTNVAQL